MLQLHVSCHLLHTNVSLSEHYTEIVSGALNSLSVAVCSSFFLAFWSFLLHHVLSFVHLHSHPELYIFLSYTSWHSDFLSFYLPGIYLPPPPLSCLSHTIAIQDESRKISQYQLLLDRLPHVNKATLQALINHLYWWENAHTSIEILYVCCMHITMCVFLRVFQCATFFRAEPDEPP